MAELVESDLGSTGDQEPEVSVGLIDLGPVPGAVPPAYIGERFGHDGCQSRHCRLYQSSGCRLTLFRPDFCITLLVV